MSTLYTLQISAPDIEQPVISGETRESALNIAHFFMKLAGGHQLGTTTVTARQSAVAASATVTLAAVQAADTVTIAGVVLTAVNDATPAAGEFDMSGTNSADADSLVAAITANAVLAGAVTATNSNGVVTVTSKTPGTVGNAITFVSSNGTRLAVTGSGYLAGGAETAISLSY